MAIEPPPLKSGRAPANPIDRFILAKLEQRGLSASPPADRRVLIRRATFDLTGLPPTPEEVRDFLEDRSETAFAAVVERLLASPRYGERWGRHWMDVVRYADTAGDNADYPVPELHLYRDYIIDAFNDDLPFDQFAREQLAGDILARRQPSARATNQIVATGFLASSRRYGTGPYELWHLTLENTIETVGQAFLGLNMKCARCHDHKFDPLTMRDYYGLYGIFASTEFPWAGSEEVHSKNLGRLKFVPLTADGEQSPEWEAWRARVKALRDELGPLEKQAPTEKEEKEKRDRRVAELKQELKATERWGAPAGVPLAYAVREGAGADVPLQRRGEPEKPGAIVPRCAPAVLAGPEALKIPQGGSGRLEFAGWLTEPSNPLLARVMVNRIWQHHFGDGLVATPNNFGLRGDEPVHRELLDYLAARFSGGGWSVKAMHRLVMNSATYQQAGADQPANREIDPSNRYLWHFEMRRLEAEAIRDAMLAVSGELEVSRPGRHPFPPPETWTWTQHSPFKEMYESKHRSVFLMTPRIQKLPFLALFDGPDTNTSTELRRASTVPQQALYGMNNPFVQERARALAKRLLEGAPAKDQADPWPGQIQRLHQLALGRPATEAEAARHEAWLRRMASDLQAAGLPVETQALEAWTTLARVVLNSNEFIYVE